MVKVVHCMKKPSIFKPNQVLRWNFYIFKSNVRSTSSWGVTRFNLFCFKTLTAFDQEHRNTTHAFSTSSTQSNKVLRIVPIGDPLLRTIHNVVGTIGGFYRGGTDIRNITTSKWFCNCQANAFFPCQNFATYLFFHPILSKLKHWRKTNTHSRTKTIDKSRTCKPTNLFMSDALVKVVKSFNRYTKDFLWSKLQVFPRSDTSTKKTNCTHLGIKFLRRSLSTHLTSLSLFTDIFLEPLA
mmetsp:Transcript_7408/g.11890  ORF Transcript_7408/g.11890 Transcript_7408/m.11890 type:complete len:239 (+) Transcript_7408:514-1230(+)